MKPFELPVEKEISTQTTWGATLYRIIDKAKNTLAIGLTEETADVIVHAINSHEKLVSVSEAVQRYDKAAKEGKCASEDYGEWWGNIVDEAKQALKEAEKT